MPRRDYLDIIAGLVLAVLGLTVSFYTTNHYNLGTVQRMGPGMFPMALGVLIAGLGLLLSGTAFFRSGTEMPEFRTRPALAVLLGVIAFALTIRPFGLIPAVLSVSIISSLAERKVRPFSVLCLSAVLCLLAFLIFRLGLGMTFSVIRWPFQ